MAAGRSRPGRAQALPESALLVATVGRPHGVKGELRLFPAAHRPERLEDLTEFWLLPPAAEGGGEARHFEVESLRLHGRAALVTARGLVDREEAAGFTGWEVHARREELPPWGPDEFAVVDALGATLFDGERRLGEVVSLLEISGRDYFEILHEGRRVLVPAVKDWLVELDLAGGRIVLSLPEGLVEAQEPEGGPP